MAHTSGAGKESATRAADGEKTVSKIITENIGKTGIGSVTDSKVKCSHIINVDGESTITDIVEYKTSSCKKSSDDGKEYPPSNSSSDIVGYCVPTIDLKVVEASAADICNGNASVKAVVLELSVASPNLVCNEVHAMYC